MREARGVVCLKFNVRNFGNVVDAFMHKIKKGPFTNNVDPEETPQKRVCRIYHFKHILGNAGQYFNLI